MCFSRKSIKRVAYVAFLLNESFRYQSKQIFIGFNFELCRKGFKGYSGNGFQIIGGIIYLKPVFTKSME